MQDRVQTPSGAHTPACLARRIGPVMSDMCSVVCEPATPQQLAWPRPRFPSAFYIKQSHHPAPGTRGARPLPLPVRPTLQSGQGGRRRGEGGSGGGEIGKRNHTSVLDCGSYLRKVSYGQRFLIGYSPWGCKDLDMTV